MCDILKSANIPKNNQPNLVGASFVSKYHIYNNSKFKMQGIDLLVDKIVDVGD